MSGGEGARRRRDPRAERRGRGPRPPREAAAPTELPLTVIDDPAYLVLVVPDLPRGEPSAHDRDVLGAARLLADAGGGAVAALAFGDAADLDTAGADRVIACDVQGYAPERRAAAVIAATGRYAPRHLLFPDSATGGDLGRRVAARLGERAATHVVRIGVDTVVRRAGGGSQEVTLATPRILLLAEEAAEPAAGVSHEARPLEPVVADDVSKLRDLGRVPVDPREVPLPEAEVIVAAGSGVSDWEAFHGLAAALGASEGASRVVVDKGLLPKARQVGTSGALVSARCYLALGISGAPQHLQGIERCERVVSVNTDRHCPMAARADLTVVGDAQAVMTALSRRLEGTEDDA
jgi:electron transfer flavoprotein alpha subunit